MTNPSFFDSCVIIDMLRGSPVAKRWLELAPVRNISVITRSEILVAAMTAAENDSLQRVLKQFTSWPVTDQVADLAAKYRRDHSLKLPDAMILATADSYGWTLLTRDRKLLATGTNTIGYQFDDETSSPN
jgi:predicted nucleic acid-binding protein